MPADTAVSRAEARKEALEQDIERCRLEIERCQAEVRDIDTFLAMYTRFAGDEGMNEAPQGSEADHPHAESSPDEARVEDGYSPSSNNIHVSQEQFESDARKLLIENGRPMKRGQLIKRFHSNGLRVGGNDEAKNFGTKIWKARDRFVNISGEGYWPRDIDCPAVDYQSKAESSQNARANGEEEEIADQY